MAVSNAVDEQNDAGGLHMSGGASESGEEDRGADKVNAETKG